MPRLLRFGPFCFGNKKTIWLVAVLAVCALFLNWEQLRNPPSSDDARTTLPSVQHERKAVVRPTSPIHVETNVTPATPPTHVVEPPKSDLHIPEDEQYTVFHLDYSTTNRGRKTKDGRWQSGRTTTGRTRLPPLFLDRLDHHLPACPTVNNYDDPLPPNYKPCDYNGTRLFPEDVARIEREILKFNIPRKIVIALNEASEYVSLIQWRWNLLVDTLNRTLGTRRMCPNCHIRYAKGAFVRPNLTKEPAHVRIYSGCNVYKTGRMKKGRGRDFDDQILIGECGESQYGSGRPYWQEGVQRFDYDASFVQTGSPFVRTYAFLHLSPDKGYNEKGSHLRPLHNVTAFVEQLLETPVPPFPRHVQNQVIHERLRQANLTSSALYLASRLYDASFIHGNCAGIRGSLVRKMIMLKANTSVSVARYGKCFRNLDAQKLLGWENGCESQNKAKFHHNDCEGHRDATKTVLASHHKFGFALENTLSPDYFTEKRWQVLLAASVPVVFDNHNSVQFLPDVDAALVVPVMHSNASRLDLAVELGKTIHYYAQPQNEEEYLNRFFAWKKRGLRPDFVRKLFLSTDFLLCRICEYVAHHHFYSEEEE